MSLRSPSALPDSIVVDLAWTMNPSDTPSFDLDGFAFRFNVRYPFPSLGQLIVDGIDVLPGWNSQPTEGIGGPFTETGFGLGADDNSGVGISGNGSEFSTVIASIHLHAEGDVTGTEITFRHNNYQDPLPAAFDGPLDWQLRWQYEVTGPFQFDIGVGNPGDDDPSFAPYHGYETYQPLVIVPEPGSLMVLVLAALTLRRLGPRLRIPPPDQRSART